MTDEDIDALAGALVEASEGAYSGGEVFVNYSGKLRRYQVGRDKSAMDPDRLFIVDPRAFGEGWICWKNSQRVAAHEWGVKQRRERAIPYEMLEDHGPYSADGDGWKAQTSFQCFDADNAALGTHKFSTNSASGINSVKDLMQEIAQRAADRDPYVPVIHFADEEFHAQGQWNGKPVFPVEEWITLEEAQQIADGEQTLDEVLGGEPAPAPEPEKPKRRQRVAPEEKVKAPAEGQPKATRRRRRAVA
jgi:hypothetical protein